MKDIILPDSPLYYETLANVGVFWKQQEAMNEGGFSLIYRPGSLIPEAVDGEQLIEYIYSGEYDERMDEIDEGELDANY